MKSFYEVGIRDTGEKVNGSGNFLDVNELPRYSSSELRRALGERAYLLCSLGVGKSQVGVVFRGREALAVSSNDGAAVSINGGITIGRNPENDIVLSNDRSASRLHAQVWREDQTTIGVRDLVSLNGTRIYLPSEHNYEIPTRVEAGLAERRLRGEDRNLVLSSYGLFGVFDGAGGHSGGAAAADYAVRCIANTAKNVDPNYFLNRSAAEAKNWLVGAVNVASSYITYNPDCGITTATICRLTNMGNRRVASYVSVGDSRMYVLRNNSLSQVTKDEGYENYIYNCLGDESVDKEPPVKQFGSFEVEYGDRIILVTDGVTGDRGNDLLSDEEITRAISGKNSQLAAQELIRIARKRDDRTAIVVDVD